MWRDSDGLADHRRGACTRGGRSPRCIEAGRPARRSRLLSRFVASRWHSSAISFGQRRSCDSAARAFGPKEAVARARCVVAEAEIALVSRDLGWPAKALEAARATLEEHGDRVNAAHARYLEVRRLLLIGRIDEAERTLAELDPSPLPARVEDCSRTGGRGDRDAAPPDEGGARRAR